MYKRYYRLKEEPFNITPDPAFFFLSPSHKEALASILYGVEKRKGFLSITGEVGSGKTTVLRAYLDQVDTDKIKVVYLFNPDLSFKDLLKTILRELGFHAAASDVFAMVTHLGHALVEEFRQNHNIVLLIDEAQNIPVETLESLRMLSNLETASTKLIQIVLVGQPELDNLLNRHELRQLKQRLAVRVGIRPLTRDESFQYIDFRLNKAALKKTEVFTAGARREIVREAAGIPRVLNILCDNCLISGYGCQQKPITRRLAREVIANFRDRRVSRGSRWGYAAAAVLMLSLGLWGILTFGGKASSFRENPDTQQETLLTARVPNDRFPSPLAPSPSPEAGLPSTVTRTIPAQPKPAQAPPATSRVDATAFIGQGGPAERNTGAVAPAMAPKAQTAVKTELARRNGPEKTRATAVAPPADHGVPAGSQAETASGEPAHRSVAADAMRSNAQSPAKASSPALDPEGPGEAQEGGFMVASPEAQTKAPPPALDPESPEEPQEVQEADSMVTSTGPQANAKSPARDPESLAEPQEQEEAVAMRAGTALPLAASEKKLTALAPPTPRTGSDVSEPWSRARNLFREGRIAEAGALWQSTYLDFSANRIAIEVELNCEPKTLLQTFAMLSAPEDFYILPYQHGEKLCYRVRLGPYATWNEAASRARQVKNAIWYARPSLKKLVISSDGG